MLLVTTDLVVVVEEPGFVVMVEADMSLDVWIYIP